MINLYMINVFFGALVAWPLIILLGTEILIGKLIKNNIHQIKTNNIKLVNINIKFL